MKASKQIALLLVIVLTLGVCLPRSAHANFVEIAKDAAKWIAGAVTAWGVGKALDAAAEQAQPTEEEKKEGLPWYKYLWPGNWF